MGCNIEPWGICFEPQRTLFNESVYVLSHQAINNKKNMCNDDIKCSLFGSRQLVTISHVIIRSSLLTRLAHRT